MRFERWVENLGLWVVVYMLCRWVSCMCLIHNHAEVEAVGICEQCLEHTSHTCVQSLMCNTELDEYSCPLGLATFSTVWCSVL